MLRSADALAEDLTPTLASLSKSVGRELKAFRQAELSLQSLEFSTTASAVHAPICRRLGGRPYADAGVVEQIGRPRTESVSAGGAVPAIARVQHDRVRRPCSDLPTPWRKTLRRRWRR